MNLDFKDKRIIVFVPNHFGLPQRFKDNLEYLGFKVFLCPENDVKLSLKDRIIHAIRKIFLKDKFYKAIKKAEWYEKKLFPFVENCPKVDFALVIRPDLLSFASIKKIKEKSNKIVAYQWDGINRFYFDAQMISLFDKFFVFDERDLKQNPNLIHTTNFYFDDLLQESSMIKSDIFFVGTYMKNRINELLNLCEFFKSNQNTTDFYLKTKKKVKEFQNYNVKIVKKGISFTENILLLKKSKVLLDFKNDVHYGLSFRTFESIGYQKKLITNNELVKEYDFYNPNNIFVFKNNNFEGLKEFLKTPYQDLPKEIYEKYSFSSWIKQILN